MKLYAGIDGGQTATAAVVGDDRAVLGRGTAGPADEVGGDARSTRLRDALEGALAAALLDAGLPHDAPFEAVVAGVSGYAGAPLGVAPQFRSDRVRLMHDAPVAHAGAFAGGAGVLAIAGTGSVVYGVAEDGRIAMAGGLGYVFGDEGSAFGIARAAIRAADASESLRERLRAYFRLGSALEVARALYAGAISRDGVAGFARALLEGDRSDEIDAIVSAECAALRGQIERVRRDLGPHLPFCLVGGLAASPRYMEGFRDAAPPRMTPAEGALLLARGRA